MKMFSNNPLTVKIPYGNYYILPSIIYTTCEYNPLEFCSDYKIIEEKDKYNDLLLKVDRIVECEHDCNTNQFTVIYKI
jgi:putative component of membrane protein insertase Oxa1/YidC/SpoIIIJ protein YidD